MTKTTTLTRYQFNVEDASYVLVKNKQLADIERVVKLDGTTYIYLAATKYFKVKAHIIGVANHYDNEDATTEKLTALIKGLTRRLKKGDG